MSCSQVWVGSLVSYLSMDEDFEVEEVEVEGEVKNAGASTTSQKNRREQEKRKKRRQTRKIANDANIDTIEVMTWPM